ncbi:MAG TPA: hypothetical protein V6C95_05775 [Coleofasciculaceae cyanobacterium]
MIYTASYFEPHNHHGQLVSISRSTPKGFQLDGKLACFMPSAHLLAGWKKGIPEGRYIDIYREEIRANLPIIRVWMKALNPDEDMTLLCWEKAGDFCHRNLVAKMIEVHRPDCFGGCDVKVN